jgi:phosphoserine phosphatase RsbU/P
MTTSQKQHTPLVLVADDERSTRIILRVILQREGYEVVEVENGAHCLTAFSQRKPDIVLLDAQMPIMDGFDCCRCIKQLPGGDRVPIMMITGLQTPSDMDLAFEVGVTDFVTKPIHPPLLSRRLRYILKSSQAEMALRESEGRYRSVVDNLKEVIFQTDLEGNLSFLNPAWFEVTGFIAEEFIGKSFFEFIASESHEKLWLQFQQTLLGEISECRLESQFLTQSGKTGWMEVYFCAVRSQKLKVIGISGSFIDITERKNRAMLDRVERSVIQVFAESHTLSEAFSSLLQAIGSVMGWDYGELWLTNTPSHRLTHSQSWHSKEAASSHIYQGLQPIFSAEYIQSLWESVNTGTFVAVLPAQNQAFQAITAESTLQSAICFPILGGYDCLGVVVFLQKSSLNPDVGLLKTLDSIGSQIGAFILRKSAEEALQQYHQRMCLELRQAAEYVRALLPPSLSGDVTINHLFKPSNDLGGDVFDYYWLDPDHLVIYLLDVAGHGVQSALLSISVLNVLRSRSLQTTDFYQPATVLQELNRIFQMGIQGDDYFTIWYGVYSQVDQTLTYASAGHPPALLVQSDQSVQQLNVGGIAIGLMPNMSYSQASCHIESGSCLYVLSDGVYEINQANGQLWEFEAFIELISAYQEQPKNHLESIYTQICGIKNSNTFDDDFSLIQVNFNPLNHSHEKCIEKVMVSI